MRMNLLDDNGWLERTWPPERPGFAWRRKRVAGENLGASLYELPPGQRTFPYHYELGNDELLVVVSGRPTLRAPDGERELRPGDCVLFRSGPEGAHQIRNDTTGPVRVLVVSNFALPRAAVQPDSGKIMIRWGDTPDDRRWFPLASEADYWEGEADLNGPVDDPLTDDEWVVLNWFYDAAWEQESFPALRTIGRGDPGKIPRLKAAVRSLVRRGCLVAKKTNDERVGEEDLDEAAAYAAIEDDSSWTIPGEEGFDPREYFAADPTDKAQNLYSAERDAGRPYIEVAEFD